MNTTKRVNILYSSVRILYTSLLLFSRNLSLLEIDLSPYLSNTYLVKINFEGGRGEKNS